MTLTTERAFPRGSACNTGATIAQQSRRVFITGAATIAAEPLRQAVAGTLSAPPQPPPEITGFETFPDAPTWGFEIPDFSLEQELPHFKSFVDRTSALALGAAKHALANAGLLERETRPTESEIGCAYGTTLGCLEAMSIFWNKCKSTNPKFAPPLSFTHGYANSPSSLLCIEFGLRGPAATFSGERLAGLEALLFAFDQIAAGAGEIILAGASESLTLSLHNHLFASGELSRAGDWSDGIIPGEGAAMLVLESEASATRRNASVLAEIEGVNFFALDPKSTEAPIRIATPKSETLAFVSTPNVHPRGGWRKPLLAEDMPAFQSKLFSGDILSVSPLLGVALAAEVLSAKISAQTLPRVNPGSTLERVNYSLATGYDPGGMLGVAMLRSRS